MEQPLVSQSVVRVRTWLAANAAAERERKQVATKAGVHEKTLRLAQEDGWNPTRKTLEKLEALIGRDFLPSKAKPRSKRRAA